MLAQWLQELRDLLGYPDYESRRHAMVQWEHRWLLELQARKMVREVELRAGRVDVLAMAGEQVSRQLAEAMGKELVTTTVRSRDDWHRWGGEVTEVRGEALVIRREPKTDG